LTDGILVVMNDFLQRIAADRLRLTKSFSFTTLNLVLGRLLATVFGDAQVYQDFSTRSLLPAI
jgi:hypothetical protein